MTGGEVKHLGWIKKHGRLGSCVTRYFVLRGETRLEYYAKGPQTVHRHNTSKKKDDDDEIISQEKLKEDMVLKGTIALGLVWYVGSEHAQNLSLVTTSRIYLLEASNPKMRDEVKADISAKAAMAFRQRVHCLVAAGGMYSRRLEGGGRRFAGWLTIKHGAASNKRRYALLTDDENEGKRMLIYYEHIQDIDSAPSKCHQLQISSAEALTKPQQLEVLAADGQKLQVKTDTILEREAWVEAITTLSDASLYKYIPPHLFVEGFLDCTEPAHPEIVVRRYAVLCGTFLQLFARRQDALIDGSAQKPPLSSFFILYIKGNDSSSSSSENHEEAEQDNNDLLPDSSPTQPHPLPLSSKQDHSLAVVTAGGMPTPGDEFSQLFSLLLVTDDGRSTIARAPTSDDFDSWRNALRIATGESTVVEKVITDDSVLNPLTNTDINENSSSTTNNVDTRAVSTASDFPTEEEVVGKKHLQLRRWPSISGRRNKSNASTVVESSDDRKEEDRDGASANYGSNNKVITTPSKKNKICCVMQ